MAAQLHKRASILFHCFLNNTNMQMHTDMVPHQLFQLRITVEYHTQHWVKLKVSYKSTFS